MVEKILAETGVYLDTEPDDYIPDHDYFDILNREEKFNEQGKEYRVFFIREVDGSRRVFPRSGYQWDQKAAKELERNRLISDPDTLALGIILWANKLFGENYHVIVDVDYATHF